MVNQMSDVETLVLMSIENMIENTEYNILCMGGNTTFEHIRSKLINAKDDLEWGDKSIHDLSNLNTVIFQYDTMRIV